MSFCIYVKGVSPGGETGIDLSDFPGSDVLVSSKTIYDRIAAGVPNAAVKNWIPVTPLNKCLAEIKTHIGHADVTVMATGDPLFFGIGRRLLAEFPGYDIRFYPAVSSMQLCFAKFAIPWDDACFVSMHGRNYAGLAGKLLNHPKVFLFTDGRRSPDFIAAYLLRECGVETVTDRVTVFVAENIGNNDERLFRGSLQETAAEKFISPNVMIILNSAASLDGERIVFGRKAEDIRHSRGLITKDEIRAAAIHALQLPYRGVMWDVGAGSGSVGLEASSICPELNVFAVEKEKEQWLNIEGNRGTYGAWNLHLVKGIAPESLAALDDPHRIFVGGSGGRLADILSCCVERLLPGGIIVVNAVLKATAESVPDLLYGLGLDVEIKEIAVARMQYPLKEKKNLNPITIVVGRKKDKE